MATDGGEITGTKDKDANIIWLCLDDVQRLETSTQDAEGDGDSELANFFRRGAGRVPQRRRAGKAAPELTSVGMTAATLEVPQPARPSAPVVPDVPTTPAVPDPGTPADPDEPAVVPPPREPATPIAPEEPDQAPEPDRERDDPVENPQPPREP